MALFALMILVELRRKGPAGFSRGGPLPGRSAELEQAERGNGEVDRELLEAEHGSPAWRKRLRVQTAGNGVEGLVGKDVVLVQVGHLKIPIMFEMHGAPFSALTPCWRRGFASVTHVTQEDMPDFPKSAERGR